MNADLLLGILERRAQRRNDRRSFLVTGSAAVAGAGLLSSCFGGGDRDDDGDIGVSPAPTPSPTPSPTPTTAFSDADILNFALNLEYLEAQFYSYAVTGAGLAANLLTGTGTQGAVTGGRQVSFSDPLVRQYATEIQQDEVAHVAFLRRQLGANAVAQPAIDVGTSASGAFSSAARAAGLISGASATFDPYASDENFLLGAFIFEDVGVTAYKGAAPLITNKTFVEASAGILAAEAYHASLIRTVLNRKGVQTPSLIDATEKISDARDALDGPSDLDQGIRVVNDTSNIAPADANGIAFSRSSGQVLNIAYLNKAAVTQGGFFPNGVNGNIRTSAAN